MNISIHIEAGADLIQKLQAMGEDINTLPKSMEKIGAEMKRFSEDEVFRSNGGVINAIWPRLSDSYNFWKANTKSKNAPLVKGHILVYSGAMQQGFEYESGDNSVSIGNKQEYWVYHQEGTSKMPKREVIGFNKTEKNTFGEYIKQEITEKLTK